MTRLTLVSALMAAAILSTGCATQTAAPTPKHEVVDSMIARYAEEATIQLRRLSENTGASRTVTPSGAGAAASGPAAGTPSGATIAGRMGSVAISPSDAPAQQVTPASLRSEPIPNALQVPAGLEKPLTLAWTGDLESLIFIIGKETGWKVVEPTGLRVAPVVIAINAQNRPAFEVLRDVGAIAGTAADVVVSVNNRTLGVAYPKR